MGGPACDGSIPVSSKSRSRFQSLSRRICGMGAVLCLAVMAGAGATMPDGRPTPTGLEVPRWVSLKSSEVRARTGPGLDYEILWEYRAAGLPIQVIAETREWRKICDPEGSVAWVHRSVVSARRGAFNASVEEVPIHSGRSETVVGQGALLAALGDLARQLQGRLVRSSRPEAQGLGPRSLHLRRRRPPPVRRVASGGRSALIASLSPCGRGRPRTAAQRSFLRGRVRGYADL